MFPIILLIISIIVLFVCLSDWGKNSFLITLEFYSLACFALFLLSIYLLSSY